MKGDIVQSSHRLYGPCSACGDGDTAMEYHNHDPLPHSYTLPELQQLVHEFTGPGLHGLQNTAIALSYLVALDSFIEWLEKREREVGHGT